MRAATRLVIIVAALIGSLLVAGPMAHADPLNTPSADPASNNYNPRAWMTKWTSDGVAGLPSDIKSRLEQTGMVFAATPEQYAALTPSDVDALTSSWSTLVANTWNKTRTWSTNATSSTDRPVPEWSPADSDSVARDLGATNYSALSPGLKSVAQRIATIVTGDFKPSMPDDAWASWMPAQVRAAYDARPNTRFDWKTNGAIVVGAAPGGISTCGGSAVTWLCEALSSGANTVADAADFVSDPFGWIGAKMAAGTAAIWGWIAGLANAGTAPDLSVDWWVDAYKKAMAVGIVLALLVLVWQFIQLSAKRISGPELLESIILWTPAYLAGIVFGPPLGQFFIQGSTALTDGIVASFSGFSASATDESMKAAFEAAGSGKAIGGIFVGIFVLIFAVIGAIVLFCSLAIQTLALYLSSALFAVGFAWIISVRHRGGSMKIPFLFLGMLFSRPILFFLLGIGLAITNNAMTFSDEGAQNLANLLMAVVAMFIAAFTPLLLMKFAPVSPAGSPATGGAVLGGAAVGGAAAGGSMLAGLAARRAGRQGSGAAPTRGGGRGPASGGAGAAGAGGGGAGASGPAAPSGPAGGAGPSGAQRAAAAGSSGPGTARPAGLQRRSAAPGGPPSVHGQRLARDTGQPTVAGSPVRKPAAGGRPASARPAASGAPGVAAAPSSTGAGAFAGPSGRGLPVQRGSASSRRAASLGGTARRLGQTGRSAARDGVEGLDGDQRWDSLR